MDVNYSEKVDGTEGVQMQKKQKNKNKKHLSEKEQSQKKTCCCQRVKETELL